MRDNGPYRIFTVCTGGGAGLQGDLWSVPGSSNFLVGSAFPYAKEATVDFLGFEPDKFCHEDTAIHLAMEAYQRAWIPEGAPAIGLGLTASVASTREHRGDHRVFAACVTQTECMMAKVVVPKGVGYDQRDLDGFICDYIGLNLIFDATRQAQVWHARIPAAVLDGLGVTRILDQKLQDLLYERPYFAVDGTRHAKPPEDHNHFPGAFNPPHAGHFGMAKTVDEFSGRRTLFCVTADSPHKDELTVPELLQRVKMLKGRPVLLTRGDPLYLDKAKQHPGTSFIIGADAFKRMFNPKWGVDPETLTKAFWDQGGPQVGQPAFYVLGRERDGVWIDPKEVCAHLGSNLVFQPIPGRWDISSTEVRKAAGS